jgi:hypothetical protein
VEKITTVIFKFPATSTPNPKLIKLYKKTLVGTRRPPGSRRDGAINRPALPLAEAARKRSEVLWRTKNFGRHCVNSKKKKNCNPYFIVIMITVLIMNVIFWVVNFKTQNYFVISTTQKVYLRLSMYDCSNFVHSYRIFGISELQTV